MIEVAESIFVACEYRATRLFHWSRIMMFDGQRWVICRTVVALPRFLWHGEQNNYVTFGKICPYNKAGAIKTSSVYRCSLPRKLWGGDVCPPPDGQHDKVGVLDGVPFKEDFWYVYAVPIKNEGHSLTNLMYAPKNYSYMMRNGQVYVCGPGARK